MKTILTAFLCLLWIGTQAQASKSIHYQTPLQQAAGVQLAVLKPMDLSGFIYIDSVVQYLQRTLTDSTIFKTRKKLTKKQRAALTKLFPGNNDLGCETGAYCADYAVLLLDKKGHLSDFAVFCEQDDYLFTSPGMSAYRYMCPEKVKRIRQFFRAQRIPVR